MEFLSANLINTTTQLVLPSATNLAQYLIDKNKQLQYQTSGYSTNTSCVISVEFASPTVMSNILLQNHNFKNFRLFYNSVTANSVEIVANNSATSHYFNFNSITVSSVQLQIDSVVEADTERFLGEFIISEKQLVFERNPSIDNFTPNIDRIQVRHIMADGGISLHNIRDKFKVKVKANFISEAFYESLADLFNSSLPLYFVPFPTTSSWTGQAYEMVWSGDFDFKYSANVKSIGYSGTITLEETPSL
jgi:hypothetical protein